MKEIIYKGVNNIKKSQQGTMKNTMGPLPPLDSWGQNMEQTLEYRPGMHSRVDHSIGNVSLKGQWPPVSFL